MEMGRGNEMKVFISGPMTGYPYYNFAAFDAVAQGERLAGNEVLSPAGMDREAGFNPFDYPEYAMGRNCTASPIGFDKRAAIDRDIEAVKMCDRIVMLKGWRKSVGARAEYALAAWMGKEVVDVYGDAI